MQKTKYKEGKRKEKKKEKADTAMQQENSHAFLHHDSNISPTVGTIK